MGVPDGWADRSSGQVKYQTETIKSDLRTLEQTNLELRSSKFAILLFYCSIVLLFSYFPLIENGNASSEVPLFLSGSGLILNTSLPPLIRSL